MINKNNILSVKKGICIFSIMFTLRGIYNNIFRGGVYNIIRQSSGVYMLHSLGIKIYGLDHLLMMRKLKRKSMKKL